jgi:hypothetical protein
VNWNWDSLAGQDEGLSAGWEEPMDKESEILNNQTNCSFSLSLSEMFRQI